MSGLLTADEARRLAGVTTSLRDVATKVAAVLNSVRNQAIAQQRSLKTGYQHAEDADLWITGGMNGSDDWKQAKQQLEQLGFTVTFYYRDGAQFTDMYTYITW